ncbi:NUDIX hydrolase [Antarcticibacterium sp. 1MA-6-2]|uniref:NUDIX hydrolase n=1 Tax=Antarcticibacterium sp. 1MA-6-2 TaxID=2908210 RepID=UPI002883188A|nr:NUDIX hydrolase [Antarcticibacterium sp. 1MA-6-2]
MSKQNIAVTVDVVVIYQKEEPMLLLVQRKNDPYKGKWALPGGFLEEEENLVEGAMRELKEETNLNIKSLTQIGAFGEPGKRSQGQEYFHCLPGYS